MKAIDLLKKALQDMGADGLCVDLKEADTCCSCSIEELAPQHCDYLGVCLLAKKGKDGLFYPMEVQ
jgi:hypothetical protein